MKARPEHGNWLLILLSLSTFLLGLLSGFLISHWMGISTPIRLTASLAALLLLATGGISLRQALRAQSTPSKDGKAMTLNAHTIICGWNAHTKGLLDNLVPAASGEKPELVLINSQTGESSHALQKAYPHLALHFVRGDFTEESVLVAAGLENADCAIIVPDESLAAAGEGRSKDEHTILAALAIKTIKPTIKLSAMITRPENEAHLRRIKVDTVLISGEFSDFLLARSGINPLLPQAARSILTASGNSGLRQIAIPAGFAGKTFADLALSLQNSNDGILVGVLTKEKPSSFDELLSDDDSDTDSFIKRKFREAEIDLNASPSGAASVRINPGAGFILGPHDAAFVIG